MSNKRINQFFMLSRRYLKTYLGISIVVFLFMLFFQPFSAEFLEFESKSLFFAGFGLICFLFLFAAQIVFQGPLMQQEDPILENALTASLYYLSYVICTSLAFLFYIRYVGKSTVTFITLIRVLVICTGTIVVAGVQRHLSSVLSKYHRLLVESRSAQDKLKQFSESYANRYIELISENDSDHLRIQASAIVFVRSAENYVEVGYQEGNEVKKKMIRNTLKNVEQQLRTFNNFIRTHRTSIVNILNIERLHKNFNTYWLSLVNTNETIPVSRQYLMAVKELF